MLQRKINTQHAAPDRLCEGTCVCAPALLGIGRVGGGRSGADSAREGAWYLHLTSHAAKTGAREQSTHA